MKKIFILPIIFISAFFVFSNVNASLAPQVYLTDINVSQNSFNPGEQIEGFVTLLNYEDLVVSDLVFHFQIVSHEINGVATKIIDEQVERATFTISPGREVRKIFQYDLPSNLPQDDVKFRIQLANSRGEEMGWIDKLISVGGDGKFLTVDNYWFLKNGEKLAPGAGVKYKAGQIPEVEFEVINESSFSINAFPKVITYKRNVGDVLREQEGNPIILSPGEKKIQTLFFPELRKPETYLSEVRFYDNETREAISNPVYFRWIIIGDDVEILFVKLDQTSYKAGEKAEIEIQVAGPADYLIADSKMTGILTVKMFNDNSDMAGQSRREIELVDDTITMNILVKQDIENPKIKTSIVKDGMVIDEYNFKVVPEKEILGLDLESKSGFLADIMRAVLIILVLTIIVIFIYYYLKKKSKAGRKPANRIKKMKLKRKISENNITFPVILLLGAGLFLFSANNVFAAFEITGGCLDTLMIFNTPLPNRIYNVNDVINFSGKFKAAGPGSGSFFNKISFYITEDKDIEIRDCCGDIIDDCSWQLEKSCKCKDGYLNYYGASSSFYDYPTDKAVKWFNEVKFLDESQEGVYRLGTIYPSDTLYGDPWIAYNQSFIVPDDLDFSGPVRLYVQYSGTHWTEYWQWSVTFQKSWINENKPPYVELPEIDGEPSYCESSAGRGRIGLKWVYQDDEGDRQSQYRLQIAADSSFNKESIVIDSYSSVVRGDPPGTVNTSPVIAVINNPDPENFELGYNSTYYWRVKVKDENGVWSQWKRGSEFSTPSHAYPWPKFRWTSENFIAGENVSFSDDDSRCYKNDGSEFFCRDMRGKIARGKVRYEWDFDYDPLQGFSNDSFETNPSHTYYEEGGYIVRLRIVDEAGSCYTSSNIEIAEQGARPPGWQPTVPGLPSGFLNNLLSFAASVFFLK